MKLKKEKGITLVALIITIIVLIIMVAVSVKIALDTGIINLASEGTENYANVQKTEEEIMKNIDGAAKNVVSNITQNGGNGGGTDIPLEKTEITPTTERDIGKYVNYKPNTGTYVKSKLDKYSGVTTNTAFTTEEDLKWRIWKVADGNVYLISDLPTTQKLTLSGVHGYNNGVTLLDQTCDTCYKGSYNGIKVENLKIEEVTSVVTVANTYEAQYGTQPYTYTFAAPIIWTSYEASKEDAINNRSIAYELTVGGASRRTSIKPYYTYWLNNNTNVVTAYTNKNYKELVTDSASRSSYWLSSRFVCPWSGSYWCYFGLQVVYYGSVGSASIYNFSSGSASSKSYSNAVRPLVSIPLTSCILTESETAGMDYDIKAKS